WPLRIPRLRSQRLTESSRLLQQPFLEKVGVCEQWEEDHIDIHLNYSCPPPWHQPWALHSLKLSLIVCIGALPECTSVYLCVPGMCRGCEGKKKTLEPLDWNYRPS
ncbi:mCG144985, partial [Mus musculus]